MRGEGKRMVVAALGAAALTGAVATVGSALAEPTPVRTVSASAASASDDLGERRVRSARRSRDDSREAGEDVRGPCDEPEHFGEARCGGSAGHRSTDDHRSTGVRSEGRGRGRGRGRARGRGRGGSSVRSDTSASSSRSGPSPSSGPGPGGSGDSDGDSGDDHGDDDSGDGHGGHGGGGDGGPGGGDDDD